ncbi:MAG TPA: hypothetical protein VHS58_09845 [Acetobacteraceae bacterium]|jgi:hypothetical protein|nr:hypothetical protein [Acetobacteraceae bacterium]
MPIVTVVGASGNIVSIPVTSTAAQSVGQNVLSAVTAAMASSAELRLAVAQSVTIPSSSRLSTIVADAPSPVSVTTLSSKPVTVVSGQGGLTFTQDVAAPGTVIVTGGGRNAITLAAGATTVTLDTSPTATVSGVAIGTSTVDARAGHALIQVNAAAHDAADRNAALVLAAGADTVALAGDATGIATAAIGFDDPSVQVTLADRSAAFLAGASANIAAGPGDETVGVLAGTTEGLTGAARGGGTIVVASGSMLTGNLLINPRSQNVTVFGGSGATTLFGTGDGTATNTGRDFVANGVGYFRLGTAGGSIAESARSLTQADATTLIGGGAGDMLYAQSGNVSLRGSYGTVLLWAAGGVSLGGTAVAAAPTGVTIDAGGAVGATITGATSGGNTIISGTGSAVAWGNHRAQGGNVYLDGAPGGQLTIMDFTPLDTFRLTPSQHVSGLSGNTVLLSDGTRITIADGLVNSANLDQFFHQ